jgi:hypothetical protein
LPVNIFDRAVTNAMNGVTGIRQFSGKITADKTVGTGYPERHNAALCPTNE